MSVHSNIAAKQARKVAANEKRVVEEPVVEEPVETPAPVAKKPAKPAKKPVKAAKKKVKKKLFRK